MGAPLNAVDASVGAVVAVVLSGLGTFVFATAPRRPANRAFALLALALAGRTLVDGVIPVLPRDALAFRRLPGVEMTQGLGLTFAIIAPALLLLLASDFPRASPVFERRPAWRLGFVLPPLAFATLVPNLFGIEAIARGAVVYGAVLSVLAFLFATYARRDAADAFEQDRARRNYVAVAWIVTAELAGLVPWAPLERETRWLLLAVGCGLVAFEIVRFQVVGIERRFRAGAKYVASTSVLVAFLIMGDGYFGEFFLEPFFGFTTYYWLFAGLAGVLLFKPIEAVVSWIVGRVFPDPASRPELYEGRHGRDVYRAQLLRVLRDGVISAKERRLLETLRHEFAMTKAEAQRIEAHVRRGLASEGRLSPTVSRRKAAHRPRRSGL